MGNGDGRAISPVIGSILLVVIAVLLASVGGALFLSLTDEKEPQPNVVLEGQETEDVTHTLVHRGGETLSGDRLVLQGAANETVAAGKQLMSEDTITFYPTAEEITVVWQGDNDVSYTLSTMTVGFTVPQPDERCDWVGKETNGGVDSIKIDSIVVQCDVETNEQIEMQNGGAVIGDVISDLKELDADDAAVYGDVTVEKVLNLQSGRITGSVASQTEDVKIEDGTVGGTIAAQKVVEITNESFVDGNVQSHTKDSKILGDSVVEGSVTADGLVKVEDSTIVGDVYAEPGDFDCTNAEINGENCTSYTPKDPDDW